MWNKLGGNSVQIREKKREKQESKVIFNHYLLLLLFFVFVIYLIPQIIQRFKRTLSCAQFGEQEAHETP